jgi:dephospho-CoA kinase
MPGAGKSTAAKAVESLGMKRIVMGDVVREETSRRGLNPDAKNTGDVMKDLRKKLGDWAVAELCVVKMKSLGEEKFVVDGVRSEIEAARFRKEGKVLLLGVHASRDRRYALLRERGRSDDPMSYEMFIERDVRELGVGIGNAIALADEVISNEHETPDTLAQTAVRTVKIWLDSGV